MNTSPYFRDRARRWADEVAGIGKRKPLFTQLIDMIARRDGVDIDTVKTWIRRAEKERK